MTPALLTTTCDGKQAAPAISFRVLSVCKFGPTCIASARETAINSSHAQLDSAQPTPTPACLTSRWPSFPFRPSTQAWMEAEEAVSS